MTGPVEVATKKFTIEPGVNPLPLMVKLAPVRIVPGILVMCGPAVAVAVGVGVLVGTLLGVGVFVGTLLGEGVTIMVRVGVGVATLVGVRVGTLVGVGVPVGKPQVWGVGLQPELPEPIVTFHDPELSQLSIPP